MNTGFETIREVKRYREEERAVVLLDCASAVISGLLALLGNTRVYSMGSRGTGF